VAILVQSDKPIGLPLAHALQVAAHARMRGYHNSMFHSYYSHYSDVNSHLFNEIFHSVLASTN
jgi:hypothetical protein